LLPTDDQAAVLPRRLGQRLAVALDHPVIPLLLSLLAVTLGYGGGYLIGSGVSGLEESPSAALGSYAPEPAEVDPVEMGRQVFAQFGCANCHGADGVGGVANANSATAEQVPSLIYVKEAYTVDEIKALIRRGVPVIGKLDSEGPTPPLFMPPWEGAINDRQLDDLVKFLFHLYPEEEDLDW